MKRFLAFLCALTLTLAGLPQAGAAEAQYITVQFYNETLRQYEEPTSARQVGVTLNGEPLEFDVPGLIRVVQGNDGRTMVPVRPIAEALGAEVEWKKESRQVVITTESDTIVLTLGSATAEVNGESVALPGGVPACVASCDGVERTLVPLRFVSEQLHAQVDWEKTFVAHIKADWLPDPPRPADGLLLRVESDDNAQTITLRLSNELRYEVQDFGDRVVIDLLGTAIGSGKDGELDPENLVVENVRYAQHENDLSTEWATVTRVVLDLAEGCSLTENVLLTDDEPHRSLVIQTFPSAAERPPVEVDDPENELAFTVVLDAGHGGSASGAVYEDVMEKDITLPITLRVGELLRERGYNVVFTRNRDEYMDLYTRSDIANAVRGDIFVSIHANASATNRNFQGTFTYSYPGSEKGEALAGYIQSAVCAEAGSIDRGLLTNNYVVLRETEMPAALLELGFMSCHEELTRLIDPDYQEKLAQGTARGIAAYLDTLPPKTAERLAEEPEEEISGEISPEGDGERPASEPETSAEREEEERSEVTE